MWLIWKLTLDRGPPDNQDSVLDFPTADDFTSLCPADEMGIELSSAMRLVGGCELARNVSECESANISDEIETNLTNTDNS